MQTVCPKVVAIRLKGNMFYFSELKKKTNWFISIALSFDNGNSLLDIIVPLKILITVFKQI